MPISLPSFSVFFRFCGFRWSVGLFSPGVFHRAWSKFLVERTPLFCPFFPQIYSLSPFLVECTPFPSFFACPHSYWSESTPSSSPLLTSDFPSFFAASFFLTDTDVSHCTASSLFSATMQYHSARETVFYSLACAFISLDISLLSDLRLLRRGRWLAGHYSL